jgi:hypothetical protein
MHRGVFALAIVPAVVLGAPLAHADDDPNAGTLGDLPVTTVSATPPPSNARYVQYGVAFTGEFVGFLSSPGPMCDDAQRAATTSGGAPQHESTCILGSGGGVAIRLGYRPSGPWYLGTAYELSKQDPNKLYRLAILQQLRGEARYYFRPELQTQPFAAGGVGVAGYGDEWSIDTWGPLAYLGAGAETQISRRTLFSVALAYRAILFSRFTDTSGAVRPSGVATMIGIDLALEARDPL